MYIQVFKILVIKLLCLLLVSCTRSIKSTSPKPVNHKYVNLYTQKYDSCGDLKDLPDLSLIKDPIPKYEPKSRSGNPKHYTVFNKTYKVLDNSVGYMETGAASWYGAKFHGFRTSSGEIYDMYKMTAAHKTLPLPTYAKVVNLQNNKSVIVKINDRGPFHGDRILDLSYVAASKLGLLKDGIGKIKLIALTPIPNNNSLVNENLLLAGSKKNLVEEHSTINLNKKQFQVGAFKVYNNATKLADRLEQLLNRQISEHNYKVIIKVEPPKVTENMMQSNLYKVLVTVDKGDLDGKHLNQILSELSTTNIKSIINN